MLFVELMQKIIAYSTLLPQDFISLAVELEGTFAYGVNIILHKQKKGQQ